MTIRLFQEGDREHVDEFFSQLHGEAEFFFNRGGANHRDTLKFFGPGDDSDNIRWVAVADDGKMVGYVFLIEIKTKIPKLGICVAESARGRHLGSQLMKTAETWARENGKGGILLATHSANIRGQSLYEKCGYCNMGVQRGSGEFLYLLRF